MAAFEILTDLPLATQKKVAYIQAIPSAQRTVNQAAFLTALTPYLTNAIISMGTDGLITCASGLTVPTGYPGFRKGATFIKTDASGNGQYMNVGSTTVASWDLVDQASTANIDDGAVTLAKMANMATASLIYRKTAAAGVPEVQTLATLKTDLGLTGTNSGDQTITLTGNVTGTGTGTFAATLATLPTGSPVNAVAAVGTLTATSGGNDITDGMTVTVNGKVYTFKTTLTPTEGQVLIGTNDTAALLNLKNALNHTGTPDTDYKCAAVHPTVTGTSSNATTVVMTAKTKGAAGNALTLTKSGGALSVDGAGFMGGTTAGVNGTVGVQWQPAVDGTNLYVCIATNTVADTNWRKIGLGSAY